MSVAPLSVLLLGWNEAPRTGEGVVPAVRQLVLALAPQGPLSVLLPRLPSPPLRPAAGTRVTGLADLRPEEVRAPRPRPDQRPAAWQRPVAPYVGATETPTLPAASAAAWTAPAAPYLGATPGPSAVGPAALGPVYPVSVAAPAPAEPTQLRPDAAGLVPAGAALGLETAPTFGPNPDSAADAATPVLNRDAFAPEHAEPGANEAVDLTQPENDLVPDSEAAPGPGSFSPPLASLPEGLAALGAELPPAADLNFQVIQYARFATRRALLEDFSVIYATDWPTWLAALELRQQTGRPLVLHVHSLAQERATPADRGWALELERLTLRRADLVLAATVHLAELLPARYPFLAGRVQALAPTDTETLTRTLRELGARTSARQPVPPFFPPTA